MRVFRSKKDKVIGGLCSGISARFNIDVSILRLLVIVAGFIFGFLPVLSTYLVICLIIPTKDKINGYSFFKTKEKMIFGVCSGLAYKYKRDPNLIRSLTILATLLTGVLPGVILYLLLGLFWPIKETKEKLIIDKRLFRSKSNKIFLGIIGGYSEYFGFSPKSLRIFFAIITTLTLFIPITIWYLISSLIIPLRPYNTDIEIVCS